MGVLVEDDGARGDRCDPDRSSRDARDGTALFVVRAATPGARVLYKVPVLTYHA